MTKLLEGRRYEVVWKNTAQQALPRTLQGVYLKRSPGSIVFEKDDGTKVYVYAKAVSLTIKRLG